jgi:hypothetical protein
MSTHHLIVSRTLVVFALFSSSILWRSNAVETNRPPEVRIIYPETFGPAYHGLWMRFKAEASDPDGSISEVRFYVNEALRGTVTNAPYNLLLRVTIEDRRFVAVARDDKGAETQSPLVELPVDETPVNGIVVLEPKHGTIVPAGANLEITADITAISSQRWTNGVSFYLDGLLMGERVTGPLTPTNPPASLIITNLAEGEHNISVSVTNVSCNCPTHTIRAVNLALRDPLLTTDNKLDFEVITAFPGRATAIQYSTNFVDWTELQRITPDKNYFRFVAPIELATSRRWYRASVANGP